MPNKTKYTAIHPVSGKRQLCYLSKGNLVFSGGIIIKQSDAVGIQRALSTID